MLNKNSMNLLNLKYYFLSKFLDFNQIRSKLVNEHDLTKFSKHCAQKCGKIKTVFERTKLKLVHYINFQHMFLLCFTCTEIYLLTEKVYHTFIFHSEIAFPILLGQYLKLFFLLHVSVLEIWRATFHYDQFHRTACLRK